MKIINVEIKARCHFPEKIRSLLLEKEARFIGLDHQVDTYFKCPTGRLKTREGKFENALIWYQRPNLAGAKRSDVQLFRSKEISDLKNLMIQAFPVDVVVDKQREIYFIQNVKFHIDQVASLGFFVEIEAIDREGSFSEDLLLEQCQDYTAYLGIEEGDFVDQSYSDLIRSHASG